MSEVGSYLKNKREELNISYDELYQSTKIRTLYIKAIEEGNFDCLPGEVYLRGFLRTISRELKVDYDHVLALYETETNQRVNVDKEEEGKPTKAVKPVKQAKPKAESTSQEGKKGSGMVWLVFGLIVVGCIVAALLLTQNNPPASLLL